MPGNSSVGSTRVLRAMVSGSRPVVLIDGGSGSGKTTLARALADEWPGGAVLLRLDDVYPGWDGLEAASRHLHDHVLEPRAAGHPSRWQRWDWEADVAAEWHDVDSSLPLIVEGSGALSRQNRELADFAIWVDLDATTRKLRALERDGELYAPFWDRWARQEQRFAEREHPRELADVVVDGRDLEAGPQRLDGQRRLHSSQ